MEPLSASASIVALLQLSGTVISYLSDIKGGPKEIQRIRSEICSMPWILSILQTQADEGQQGNPWSSTLRVLNEPNGPLQQLHTVLKLLERKLAPASGMKRTGKMMKWPFEKGEIHSILNTVERQKSLINLARQNDHIALTKAIKDDVESMQLRVDDLSKGLSELHMSTQHQKIHGWLNAPDPSSNHKNALATRQKDTGDWFIQSRSYVDWLSKSRTLLWLYGIPGCGKTILSSTIVHQTLEHSRPRPGAVVLYFYFDFNDTRKQQHEPMIRSLISQLSTCSAKSLTMLEALYSSNADGERQPTFQALLEILHHMLMVCDEPYIILDALDECEERDQVLDSIRKILAWPDTTSRILVTSRREKDIEAALSSLVTEDGTINIQGSAVDQDIRAYIRSRLLSDLKLCRWQKAHQEIENRLMQKADGMFRWAACQLDELRNCRSLVQLHNVLNSLPKTLDATYERILCKIGESDRIYARKILQWLAFSVRSLSLEEIVEVTAIDIDSVPMCAAERRLQDVQDVLEICSSLVTVTYYERRRHWRYDWGMLPGYGNFVRLAHYSVKEFLISDRIRQGHAMEYSIQDTSSDECLANDCIAYLTYLDNENVDPEVAKYLLDEYIGTKAGEIRERYPLFQYALDHWTDHASIAEQRTGTAVRLGRQFLLEDTKYVMNWVKGFRVLTSESPLWYATCFNLVGTAKQLIDDGVTSNDFKATQTDLLEIAVQRGNLKMVKLLLEHGANASHERLLYDAARYGRLDIMEFYLARGADANARDVYGSTALITASAYGWHNIVSLLLQYGADVNARDKDGQTALIRASIYNYHDIVSLLLQCGADINARDEDGQTALITASAYGYHNIVSLLL
ncbi:MAG: hypothetical protein Q9200_003089 [Gallowayella weberi]